MTTHTSFQPIYSFFNFNKRTTPIDIFTHTLLQTFNSQYLSNILSWTRVLMVYIFESHLNFKFWGKFKFYMQQIRVTPGQYCKLNVYRKISLQNEMFLTIHTKNRNQPYFIFEILSKTEMKNKMHLSSKWQCDESILPNIIWEKNANVYAPVLMMWYWNENMHV